MTTTIEPGQVWRRKKDDYEAKVTEVITWPPNGEKRVFLRQFHGWKRSEMWAKNLVKNYELLEVAL